MRRECWDEHSTPIPRKDLLVLVADKNMEEALLRSRTRRSSSIYSRLAQRVSLSRCKNPAFLQLKACLREWFPREENNIKTNS